MVATALACLLAAVRASDADDLLVRAWHSPKAGTDAWPEADVLDPERSVGVALSGGGARAFSAGFGGLRALTDLGVMDRARYIVGISGGGWATTSYTFHQATTEEVSEERLLGPVWRPENITLELLEHFDKQSARYGPARDFDLIAADATLEFLLGQLALEDVAPAVLGRMFAEPLGVPRGAIPTWSAEALKDITDRNPALAKKSWVYPRRPRAFPIIDTMFLAPSDMIPTPLQNRSYYQSELTPLYCGVPFEANVTYTKRALALHDRTRTVLLGGLVEPFGYGSSAPAAAVAKDGEPVEVEAAARDFTLQRLLSQTSFETGNELAEKLPFLSPQVGASVNYWAPDSVDPDSTMMTVTDGGNLENVGIMNLLRRGVKRIVLLYNPPASNILAPQTEWDPRQRLPQAGEFGDDLAALFGVVLDAPQVGFDYEKNQVFPTERLADLAVALQDSHKLGVGAVATQKLTTIENAQFGIPAGLEAMVTVVYLARGPAWEQRLIQEVQAQLPPPTSNASKYAADSIMFPSFPHYATGLTLTTQQVNLLATYVHDVVMAHSDQFSDITESKLSVLV